MNTFNLISLLLCIAVGTKLSQAFTVLNPSSAVDVRSGSDLTKMNMGLFDGLKKAFSNEEVRKIGLSFCPFISIQYDLEKMKKSSFVSPFFFLSSLHSTHTIASTISMYHGAMIDCGDSFFCLND